MTGKDKHMPLYSSSDIERYLSGELSDPEMHAMERAALDDPFLADALEGMIIHRSLPEQPSFQQDMDSLQKRLDDRVSGKKRRLLPLVVRYAASVILLLGIGATIWYSLSDRRMEPVALVKRKAEAPVQQPSAAQASHEAAVADSARIGMADDIAADKAVGQQELQPVRKEIINTAPVAKKGRTIDTLSLPTAGLTTSNFSTSRDSRKGESSKNDFSTLSKQPAAPYANNAVNNLANAPLNNTPRSILSDSLFPRRDNRPVIIRGVTSGVAIQRDSDADVFKNYKSDELVFTGKVLNTQNLPLAGATLSYKKGRGYVNTVTDANGYFSLQLPKYDTTSRMVAVNYIGYEQGFMKLNTDDKTGNIILLKPQQASLNEVVVVGYGTKRKELTRTDINSIPPPLSTTAVPSEGWPAYTNYLESNKNSPQIDTTIRGYESISFIVNKKGELSNFKAERSLSPAHDSLAIRLIKEGPSWKLLKGKKEKARVILTW